MTSADVSDRFGFRDPAILRTFEYWLEKRGQRRFPARADLDPLDLRYVIGDVCIIDVARDPRRFSYRLVGTRIVQRDGYDMTGKSLDCLPDAEYREAIRATFAKACDRGFPILGSRDQVIDDRIRAYEFLILPLAANGSDIDMLFTVQRYLPSVLAASGMTAQIQSRTLEV